MSRARKAGTRKPVANPAKVRELFSRAVAALTAGDAAGGRALLEKADRLAPGNPQILYNLAYALHAEGRLAEAVDGYRRVLAADPSSLPAWRNLATAARAAGAVDQAIGAWREVIRREPLDVAAHNDLANLLVESGRLDEALPAYRRALDLDPGATRTRANLAAALRRCGRSEQARAEYQAILDRDPGQREARMALVELLDQDNRVDEAAEVLDALPGGSVTVADRLLAGSLALRGGHSARAEQAYRAVLSAQPGHAVATCNLGLVHALRGERGEAERLFREAIAADRQLTDAWRQLAALKTFAEGDDDLEAMRRVAAGALPEAARVQLDFALGKALDDCGEHDGAFAAYRRANTTHRRHLAFDAEALAAHAERIRTVFSADWQWPMGNPSLLPVYIVGMPRSGTTLLEQILSAHPAFHGGGELLLVNRLLASLEEAGDTGEASPYPECARALTAEGIGRLADGYLADLAAVAGDSAVSRISDKMPYNFFHLGLVRMLFPHARILHCHRHPVDTCLSAYFHWFPRGLDFTYDLDDLVAVYHVYHRVMRHWAEHPAVPFHTVRYETLVEDPRGELAAVLAFLDLPWHDGVTGFHRLSREVRTLSAWQVRRPIDRARRGRWQAYAAHVGPLLDGLSDLVEPVCWSAAGD